MLLKIREPINAITHFSGAIFFFAGTIFLIIYKAFTNAGSLIVAGSAIFGLSLVLLYTSSGIYHSFKGPQSVLMALKKLDHSMIYVLIAGSYTPMCLSVLQGKKLIIILGVLWGIVLVGVLGKIFLKNIPRPVYTGFYLVMGWIVIFFIKDVYIGIPHRAFFLLALGGFLYTIGGIIYMVKKPNLTSALGFHELFHIFVLAGSLSHYLMVLGYLG